MKRLLLILSLFFGLSLISSTCWASEAYITDSFRISLRRGPNTESEILRFLTSGQAVEVLESNEEWSRIQLPDHDESNLSGWVLSRYLITRIPYEDQNRSLRQKNELLSEDLSNVKNELKDSIARENALSVEIKRYADDLDKSRKMYEALTKESTDFLVLKAEHKKSQEDIRKLIRDNENLGSSQLQKWFAIGALVLLIGLIIGHFVGKREKRMRKSYY